MKEVKRGEIWYCDFGEAFGSEQGGIRTCVIVQNNKGNKYSTTTIVCPTTSQEKPHLPTHVQLYSTPLPSCLMTEQMRIVDKRRLLYKKGNITPMETLEMNEAIKISMGV